MSLKGIVIGIVAIAAWIGYATVLNRYLDQNIRVGMLIAFMVSALIATLLILVIDRRDKKSKPILLGIAWGICIALVTPILVKLIS